MSSHHQQGDGVRQRRPSTTETIVNTAKSLEKKVEQSLLIFWDDLPAWRRDNGYITSGYRQSHSSYAHSFRSLFYLHNETVNIWSHLLGAVVFLGSAAYVYHVVRPRYETATAADVFVFACFFGGAVLCLGMSATFHCLSNHSEMVYKWGNKLDYTGIVALIVGSYFPALYYGLFCKPHLVEAYLYAICSLGVGCALVSWIERFRTPTWRPYRTMMFVALGLSGVVPIFHGSMIYGVQGLHERMSLGWVVLHGAMYIFGAFLYAFRWPERSAPGVFDIWGSSHQIFHMFVILAAVTHFYGMAKAFDHHHTTMGSACLEG
ncbi:mPR-like GPCR protein [Dactylonectria estremocensis]|uniref:MPR-like GPCR protein n=1 Tax=Dactylonectria estremocensis TaxID=1079267 RepID=A0A9P9E3Z3_9HYPO|nr:mPR-like GPCR protein [Dactylonectria estremocensis]